MVDTTTTATTTSFSASTCPFPQEREDTTATYVPVAASGMAAVANAAAALNMIIPRTCSHGSSPVSPLARAGSSHSLVFSGVMCGQPAMTGVVARGDAGSAPFTNGTVSGSAHAALDGALATLFVAHAVQTAGLGSTSPTRSSRRCSKKPTTSPTQSSKALQL